MGLPWFPRVLWWCLSPRNLEGACWFSRDSISSVTPEALAPDSDRVSCGVISGPLALQYPSVCPLWCRKSLTLELPLCIKAFGQDYFRLPSMSVPPPCLVHTFPSSELATDVGVGGSVGSTVGQTLDFISLVTWLIQGWARPTWCWDREGSCT